METDEEGGRPESGAATCGNKSSEPQEVEVIEDIGDAGMSQVSLSLTEAFHDEDDENSERRRTNRAPVTVRIAYATVDEMFSEFTRDINEGGLFIETENPHPPGTEVSMQFHLPGSTEIVQTIGRVVRVSNGDAAGPPGMGLEFDELTPDDRTRIDRIIRALRASSSS
jgi:uncharacterized protein (TIGR02266 family)